MLSKTETILFEDKGFTQIVRYKGEGRNEDL